MNQNVDPGGPLALDANRSSHQLDEPFADRQAQSGPAEPARGRRVGLREAVKQLADLRRREPDAGVDHRKTERGLAGAAHDDADLARFRELERVPHQIQQHLT